MSKLPRNENDVRQRRESWIKKWSYFRTHYYDDIESIKGYCDYDTIEPEKHLNGYIGKGINPFVSFKNGVFSFDEAGLKSAFGMASVESPSLHVKVKPSVSKKVEKISSFKKTDYGQKGQLLKIYAKRKDVMTQNCLITNDYVKMEICRWSIKGSPFGTYEILPTRKMRCMKWVLSDAEFYHLDLAKLLADLAMESKLREEEMLYYQKQIRISQMGKAILNEKCISLEMMDEQLLNDALGELVNKGETLEKVSSFVSAPWMQSIKEYLLLMTQEYGDAAQFLDYAQMPNRPGERIYLYRIKT